MEEKTIIHKTDNSENEIIKKLATDIASIIKSSGLEYGDFEDVDDMDDLDNPSTPFSEISKKIIPAVFNEAQKIASSLWKMHPNRKIIGKFNNYFIQISHDDISTILTLTNEKLINAQTGIVFLTRSDSIINLIESVKTIIQYEFDSDFTGQITTFGKRKCYTGNLQHGICLESHPTRGVEINFWMPKMNDVRRKIMTERELNEKIRKSLEHSKLKIKEIAGQIGISVSTLKKAKKDIKLVGYRSAVKIIRYLYGKDLFKF